MPNKTELSGDQTATSKDYEKLARFLIEPFLSNPQTLCVHSEVNKSNGKIWLRIAFDKSDRGKVFGRGGRTIQAIRTTIQTSALAHGESVFLDIYSDEPPKSDDFGGGGRSRSQEKTQRRKSPAKPAPKISNK